MCLRETTYLDSIKFTWFSATNVTIKKMKRKPLERDKIVASHISKKDHLEYKESSVPHNKRINDHFYKLEKKVLHRDFSR